MIVLNIDKVKKHKKSLRKSTASTYKHSKTLQQIATKIKAFFIISYAANCQPNSVHHTILRK